MAKRKRTKGQTMMYKTLYRKPKIEQHKMCVDLGAREGLTVPAQLVPPVVLLFPVHATYYYYN
jgi:hypothetical protein